MLLIVRRNMGALIAIRVRPARTRKRQAKALTHSLNLLLFSHMPPAGGMGMGIDRLCMKLLEQESIRNVLLFHQMKPKLKVQASSEDKGENETESEEKPSDETSGAS